MFGCLVACSYWRRIVFDLGASTSLEGIVRLAERSLVLSIRFWDGLVHSVRWLGELGFSILPVAFCLLSWSGGLWVCESAPTS